jgi:hypothetical protein
VNDSSTFHRAPIHWDKRCNDSPDTTQAVILMVAQQDRINHEYFLSTATEKGLVEGLADIEARVDAVRNSGV